MKNRGIILFKIFKSQTWFYINTKGEYIQLPQNVGVLLDNDHIFKQMIIDTAKLYSHRYWKTLSGINPKGYINKDTYPFNSMDKDDYISDWMWITIPDLIELNWQFKIR